jgi:hypothetical protein
MEICDTHYQNSSINPSMFNIKDSSFVNSLIDIISKINDGKANEKDYYDIHHIIYTTITKKHLVIIYSVGSAISRLIKIILRAIQTRRNKIKFINGCPIKLDHLYSRIMLEGIIWINKLNEKLIWHAKKKMIKNCFKLPERYRAGFYSLFILYDSKLFKSYIYAAMEQKKYNFGRKINYYDPASDNVSIASLIARNHREVAIRAIKNRIVDPHNFLDNMVINPWPENSRSNNVKLLKICFKNRTTNEYMSIFSDVGPRSMHDLYCYIKYGSLNLIYPCDHFNFRPFLEKSNRSMNIMILHRRYRDIDFALPNIAVVVYRVTKTITVAVCGKNLTKMICYYV